MDPLMLLYKFAAMSHVLMHPHQQVRPSRPRSKGYLLFSTKEFYRSSIQKKKRIQENCLKKNAIIKLLD